MKRCLNCMNEHEESDRICPHCGWEESPGPEDALETGCILKGRYIVGTVRHRGERDYLYAGWDALFSRKVLILEYFPETMVCRRADGSVQVKDGERERFSEGLCRFRRDNERLISLDDTPGLMNVLAVTEDFGTLYAVLEYPRGKPLTDSMKEESFSPEKVQGLIRKIAYPLAAAHDMGVCHGQIDKDHIFAVCGEEYFLGGFNSDSEQKEEGIRRDIRALAYLAGSMLTGSEQWESLTLEENLGFLRENVPECIPDAIRAVLGTDETRRPGSARRFADLLLDEATVQLVQQ